MQRSVNLNSQTHADVEPSDTFLRRYALSHHLLFLGHRSNLVGQTSARACAQLCIKDGKPITLHMKQATTLSIGLNPRALIVGTILLKERDICPKIGTISDFSVTSVYVLTKKVRYIATC